MKTRILTSNGIVEVEGLMMSGVNDINGKEIKEGDILRIYEYKNKSTELFGLDADLRSLNLTIEDVKGEFIKQYDADVVWDDLSLIAYERGDIKIKQGLSADPLTCFGDPCCFNLYLAEIIEHSDEISNVK